MAGQGISTSNDRWRRPVSGVASVVCLAVAVLAFWYQDWQYSLPTPRPEGLRQPARGAYLNVSAVLGRRLEGRPLVIHVVNPDCPCSRFNRDHMRALVRRFGDRVTFVALVQGFGDPAALESAFAAWDLGIPVVADPGGRKALQLGAYSTPQAVVLRDDGRLYYRGNYNSTRYCADAKTEFARIAIESLLEDRPLPDMPQEASVAYGCPLPPRGADRQRATGE